MERRDFEAAVEGVARRMVAEAHERQGEVRDDPHNWLDITELALGRAREILSDGEGGAFVADPRNASVRELSDAGVISL